MGSLLFGVDVLTSFMHLIWDNVAKDLRTMTEAITPRVDIAFKKIFGVDENKDLLMSLINAVVSAEDQVSKITLLNPYNPKNFRQDKLSIVDIKAERHNGKRYNIQGCLT